MTNKIIDNWYEDFFQGINCELCEKSYPDEWTQQELNFLLDELQLQPGQHVLDIPCGFGRLSIELAKKGFNVTGIDISKTFIDGLNKEITSGNLSIKAMKADILTVTIPQKFSGAICMGNSFGYFNFDKMKIFVEKVAASLETGAKFIINSGMIAESILPNFSEERSFAFDNMRMDIFNIYNADEGYMSSNLLYTMPDKTEEHSFKHYVFTLAEVKRLLKLYGLNTIATYSSFSKEKYNFGDNQIYIVAEKE